MGKNKNPTAKRMKAAAKPDGNNVPSFDENALLALTGKIEQGLGKKGAPAEEASSHKQNTGKEKKSKKSKNTENSRGTKRDAHGNAKSSDHSQLAKHKKGGATDDGSVLLQEILALGGTEDDLDLVAGAPSDDEDVEGSGTADAALQKELAKFVAGLGIDGANGGEAEEESEPEDEVEGVSENELEEASEQDSPAVPAKVLAPTVPATKKPETTSVKEGNRLVSATSPPTIDRLTYDRLLKLERIGMQPNSRDYQNQP